MSTTERPEPAADLLHRVARGEEDALAACYARFGGALLALARRFMGSREDAEDSLHDLFVALPETARSWRGDGAPEAWLRRVIVRVCLMRLRQERRLTMLDADASAALPDGRRDGAHTVSRLTLERAIAALPQGERQAFVLREVEGYPFAEIAELLGISRNAAEVRCCRARERLRHVLTEGP